MSFSAQNGFESDPFGFGRLVNTPERKVIVLWDYENCPIPHGVSGLSVVRNIREAALKFGSIDHFEAYHTCWSNNHNTRMKNDLSLSGVKLRDCPYYTGKKGAVGKTMVVDMMVYALERPRTTTVLLISGDRENAYAISTLRNRGYSVKLLAPAEHLLPGLQALVDVLDWNAIFRPDLPPSELTDFNALGGDESEEEESEEETDEEGEDEEEEEEEEEVEVQKAEEETTHGQDEAKVELEVVKEIEVGAPKEKELLVDDVQEETREEAAEVEPVQIEFKSSPLPSPTWSDPRPLPPSTPVQVPGPIPTATPFRAPAPVPTATTFQAPVPATPFQPTATTFQAPAPATPFQPPAPVPTATPFQAPAPVPTATPFQAPASFQSPPSLPAPAPFPSPAAIPPMWASAQPAVSSGVVPLEPLSARPQQQPVGKPVPPPVLSPAPPTPAQTASSISGAGTSQPSSSREHLLEEPARHIPSKFLVLVQELEAMKKEGSPEPLWSAVCLRVYKRLPSVLAKAGVTKWKAYMLLAQKEGIVDLKIPRPGDETVSLKI